MYFEGDGNYYASRNWLERSNVYVHRRDDSCIGLAGDFVNPAEIADRESQVTQRDFFFFFEELEDVLYGAGVVVFTVYYVLRRTIVFQETTFF